MDKKTVLTWDIVRAQLTAPVGGAVSATASSSPSSNADGGNALDAASATGGVDPNEDAKNTNVRRALNFSRKDGFQLTTLEGLSTAKDFAARVNEVVKCDLSGNRL